MFAYGSRTVCIIAAGAAATLASCRHYDDTFEGAQRPVPASTRPMLPPEMPTMLPEPAAPPVPSGPKDWWRPTARMTWDWQLRPPLNLRYLVDVYDIDLFDNDKSVIDELHERGRKVICYVNLGTWENWRPDKDEFPREVIGAQWPDFPNEYWLDIRAWDKLAPVIRKRLDMAVEKGCDGVEPDNLDGWNEMAHPPTGFPLTYQDQIVFNRQIAAEAHARGLAVGLKNDALQAADLVDDFDFHVSEQCFEFDECKHLLVFIAKNKPVFEAEYGLTLPQFCPLAKDLGISAIRKKERNLTSWREVCPN